MRLSWKWIALILALFVAACSRQSGVTATPGETGQPGAANQSASEKTKDMRKDDDDDDEEDEGKNAATRPSPSPAATATQAATSFGGVTITFEGAAPGTLPPEWTIAETNGKGKPATWRVEKTEGAPSGQQVMRLAETKNSGGTFNLLLSREVYPDDVVVSVKLRPDTGSEDQGGGLVWRARDQDNYYIARWNPLENNLRVYKVENAKRTMFKSTEVTAKAGTWHEVRISMVGTAITVSFDGQPLLAADDATFKGAGKVGLWTKADAASSFDDLEIKPAR